MTILATPPVELDADFEVAGQVTKTWVDQRTGNRYIRGVASGVEEDRDGERCSENCIKSMVGQVNTAGKVALTASHDQDWWSEFGEVTKGEHDAATGEFIVEAVLPPEGHDPVADKAWREVNRRHLGFSIGGKLRKAFFERNELGKRRKVLDLVQLRHIVLTGKPSYAPSFAEAVAKTFDGDPDDHEFVLTAEEVAKDSTGSWVPGGGENSGQDSKGSGPRNAGTRKPGAKAPSVDDDGANDDDADDQDGEEDEDRNLPHAKNERHLSCPNCGHEFAADLPSSSEEQPEEDEDEVDNRSKRDLNNAETGKTTENTMPAGLTDTLDELRGLVAQAETPEPVVEKTVTEDNEVAKMLAVSHSAHEGRFEEVEKQVGRGFELIAEAIRGVNERIDQLPAGRQSVARAPSGHPRLSDADEVGKTIGDDDSAVEVLKKLNAGHPAYAHLR